MEINSSISDHQTRQKLHDRVKKYSQNIENLQSKLSELRKNSERSALLAGASDNKLSTSEDHRARLTMSTERLHETGRSLENSLRTLENIEVLGAETAMLTKEQGDQMRKMKDRLSDINGEVGRGSRIIGRISRRQLTNKIILIVIILVIILAIFLVLFFAILLPIILKIKGDADKKSETPVVNITPTSLISRLRSPTISPILSTSIDDSLRMHGMNGLNVKRFDRIVKVANNENQAHGLSGILELHQIPTIEQEDVPILKVDGTVEQ